jgi:hypothetical protein
MSRPAETARNAVGPPMPGEREAVVLAHAIEHASEAPASGDRRRNRGLNSSPRCRRWRPLCLCGLVWTLVAPAWSQPEPTAAQGESAVEEYLRARGLNTLLMVHLIERLQTGEPAERSRIADRLGELYGDALEAAPSDEVRRHWEEESQKLLSIVPEAESYSLRLRLTKVAYLRAEDIAERHRLKLADDGQIASAKDTIRKSAIAFSDLGHRLSRVVDGLERREAAGQDDDPAKLRDELQKMVQLRSLAMYYAGWACYYDAFLTGARARADDALTSFGWLLNASGGREASTARVQGNMFKYDHVARAALGCALAESFRGRIPDAERWLELVEESEETSKEVRAQIGSRKIAILGAAKRWADLGIVVKGLRAADGAAGGGGGVLQPAEAQLVAVLTLEAMQGDGVPKVAEGVVRQLSDQAIADLVRLGKVSAVLALAKRYGLGSLSGDGFIVAYIRGLLAYDKARELHEKSGEKTDEPTARADVANAYRDAATSLDAAQDGADAVRFKDERAGACFMAGLAMYYAGDLVAACDKLVQAADLAAGTARAEEALWQAVVAIDRAVEAGDGARRARRDQLAQLYLKAYPRGDKAARLLVRIKEGAGLDPEQAVRVLLGVERESPLYESARREAANVLYKLVRASHGGAKDAAVVRYAEISFDLLALDQQRAIQSSGQARAKAAADAVNRARQMLDALLSMSSPDADRAARVLKIIDELDASVGLDLTNVADEIAYRRLELALARGDQNAAKTHQDKLRSLGGRFSDLADRRLYRDAVREWQRRSSEPVIAARVVEFGSRVIKGMGSTPEVLANPAAAGVHQTVAAAALQVWRATKDPAMLDLQGTLDRALLASTTPSAAILRRHAEGCEARGDPAGALDAWRRLLAGLRESDPAWFEARYHSLRLLAAGDPARAREAMDQHKVMHPKLGPAPWGDQLRALDAQTPPAPTRNESGPSPAGGPR